MGDINKEEQFTEKRFKEAGNTKFGDRNNEEPLIKRLETVNDILSEKEYTAKDLEKLQRDFKNLVFKSSLTVTSLKKAAVKLDQLWKDCNIARAIGTGFGIAGGVLVLGGIASLKRTAEAASPISILAGIGFGTVSAVINLSTSFVESSEKATEVQKAEKDLKETLNSIDSLQKNVQPLRNIKEETKLTLCIEALKSSAKPPFRAIIVIAPFFLMPDILDFGFTIREIIKNKGSEAGNNLRDKAEKIELYIKQINKLLNEI